MRLLLVGEDREREERLAKCLHAQGHVCIGAEWMAACEDLDTLTQTDAFIYAPTIGSDDAVLTSARVDGVTRGTYRLITQALDAGVRRFVLLSSLSMFAAYSPDCWVDEGWRPRPQPNAQMLPWLAERSLRELVRGTDARATCIRLSSVIPDDEVV